MNRRRFLTITAAAFATPLHAATPVWQGTALGSAASIRLAGPAPRTARLWRKVEAELTRIETTFSLHRDSALTRLNRDGHLAYPGPDLLALIALATQIHTATAGAFDPSIQPLWLATASDTDPAQAETGWQRLHTTAEELRLAPGMALTFNGIAQGHAADSIAALLRAEGYDNVLIDMGEIIGLGPTPWQAAIADPTGQTLAEIPLQNRALATSSPRGTVIGANQPHILHPTRRPQWSTVSISAPSAALADALSTAACLLSRAEIITALSHFPEARLETLA
ncbi:MAG: ApbE family lipoprotein [Rhodobacteraceae bacterium]|uniref:FAD:protein FMN transferase n=1 Tax=Cypionkella sp. TaxID=2811411 RepID=UPI00132224BC|nr:FAD:protein FMN transferase [Cypionkella sp.]KAF0172398.1 MAG: ApbE family lipoprotein [Paracoccaceae bacterium]MDO8327560.1 FAD:protein FMN transferase [Cypionkella sp.]